MKEKVDHLSKKKRSWNMSKISSNNTKPELIVRSALHQAGFRFRLHRKDLPGKPDIVLPKYRAVIFVHGCFWHQHRKCKRANIPKSNIDYWQEKLDKNTMRDKKNIKLLKDLGYEVIVIWECQVKNITKIIDKINNKLKVV